MNRPAPAGLTLHGSPGRCPRLVMNKRLWRVKSVTNVPSFWVEQMGRLVERDLRARWQNSAPGGCRTPNSPSSSPPSLATACQGRGRSTLLQLRGFSLVGLRSKTALNSQEIRKCTSRFARWLLARSNQGRRDVCTAGSTCSRAGPVSV